MYLVVLLNCCPERFHCLHGLEIQKGNEVTQTVLKCKVNIFNPGRLLSCGVSLVCRAFWEQCELVPHSLPVGSIVHSFIHSFVHSFVFLMQCTLWAAKAWLYLLSSGYMRLENAEEKNLCTWNGSTLTILCPTSYSLWHFHFQAPRDLKKKKKKNPCSRFRDPGSFCCLLVYSLKLPTIHSRAKSFCSASTGSKAPGYVLREISGN